MELSEAAKQSLMKMLDKSANTISDALDASGKLVKENAKELVSEVLVYKGYVDPTFGLMGAAIILLLNYLGYVYVRDNHNDYWMCYLGFGSVLAFTLTWALSMVQCMVKAKVAPRLFLIDYAASLLEKDTPEVKK